MPEKQPLAASEATYLLGLVAQRKKLFLGPSCKFQVMMIFMYQVADVCNLVGWGWPFSVLKCCSNFKERL